MRSLEVSKTLHQKSLGSLVGGVNSPVRSFKRVGGSPLFMKTGKGAFLSDVDGNNYIDFVMGYGPHLFGHADEEIASAVSAALKGSSSMGFSSEGEIEWAEKLKTFLPSIDKVRATSSGTESCATAIRLARGITGKNLIVKFSGHYHGHVDSLLVDSGSGLATLQISTKAQADSKGLTDSVVQNSRVLPFNDEHLLAQLFESEGSSIAALILEPVMGNMGVVPPQKGFLQKCRELTSKHSSLLIFDEVMTGFRVHRNSAQGLYDVKPDLTCLAKIIGGGLPLGALAGPSKFMDELAPLGGVYQAGTFSGNPICIAAGTTMLNKIEREKPHLSLDAFGADFENFLKTCANKYGHDVQIERVGSMMSLYFSKSSIKNAEDCKKANLEKFNTFFGALLESGVLIPPSPFESWFISTAHFSLKDQVYSSFERAFKTLTGA